MQWSVAGVLSGIFLFLPVLHAGVPAGCTAGMPLASFQLSVQQGAEGAEVLPIRSVNAIRSGQKLLYIPVDVRSGQKEKARVALVVVPADQSADLTVLEPKPAAGWAEWIVPARARTVALVFGPQGLDAKKVSNLVNRDRELIAQLADYAEKTAQTEALVEALTAWEKAPNASENMDAALRGFSSRYGVPLPKLERNAPTDQQAMVLMRTLNPALSTYDPLAPEPRQRLEQSAGLAASVAGLFFGTPVGLAAGGAAMFVNLRTLMFPGSDFRSALAQTVGGGTVTLCARREPPKPRTRMAYLWAVRVPDLDAPAVSLSKPAHLPLGAKSAISIQLGDPAKWRSLDRVRDWKLVRLDGAGSSPVAVQALPDKQSLVIDLPKTGIPAGAYKLAGKWDWDTVEVFGEFHLYDLSHWKPPDLRPASKGRLLAGSGTIPVQLAGGDLQFVEKLELKAAGAGSGASTTLRFTLPEGPRGGPQQTLDTAVDTTSLQAGNYLLSVSLPDGSTHDVPVRILPPHPRIEGLPLGANLGEIEQKITLRGEGLRRIENLRSNGAEVAWSACQDPCEKQTERELMVRLKQDAKKGDRIDLLLDVEGVEEPLRVPDAIEVRGPRPRIEQVQASVPGGLGIELRQGELPAASFVSFSIRLASAESQPILRLACAEQGMTLRPETLRIGESRPSARLWTAGEGTLFLSLDAGMIGQAGCTLMAVVETETHGASNAYELGKVIRLPRIESFEVTGEKLGEYVYAAILKGQDLETIAKAGWNADYGIPVQGLPAPVAGEAQKQTLKVAMPWPSPAPRAPLYVWLRGETQGRATEAIY